MIDFNGSDERIAAAARVSTGSTTQDGVAPLLNYLMKHRHGSPFEHTSFTFRVTAPIFVWREWHRHRIGFSYNEESGRYKTLDPVFYLPRPERPMMKVADWKAGRPKFEEATRDTYESLCTNLVHSYFTSYTTYLQNLELGVDPGLARDCLPVGIFSTCYVTCNARSLMSFLSLRTFNEGATYVSYPLWEIQLAALKLEQVFAETFPLTYEAFVSNGRVAP